MRHIGLTVASLAISLLAAGPLHAQQADANYLPALLRPTPASVPDHNCVICRPAPPLYSPPPDSPYPLALLPLPPASGPPVKNCTFCHGVSAQGLAVAPRLAGQRAAYIEKELGAFRNHSRDNPYSALYMWNAAANLHSETTRALADYFSHEAPRAADDGNPALAARGNALFHNGEPDANIVACVACHGPNAQGAHAIPRLAGLSYAYLKRRLEQWKQGYHPSAKPMPRVARSLSADQVDALASYLSFLDDRSASR
ncbi:c-type cytochrome [Rhodoblastus sp.]|uniref:c-type cytochrome n=1 Tax=Rhodoblastus sp. TaxID=1962975 RepID=UPI003F97A827